MDFLGIDLDGSTANFAWVDNQKKILKVLSSSISNVKQLYNTDLKNLKSSCVISGLSSKQVLIKQKSLKISSKKGLKKAIPFQMKSSSALPQDQSITLPFITKAGEDSSDLSFYITTKKSINSHLLQLSKTNISPDYLSFQSHGLNRFAELNFPEIKDLFVFHVGKTQTLIAYIKNGFVKSHHLIKIGTSDFNKATGKENSENQKIDFSKISTHQSQPLRELTETYKNETAKAFLSFTGPTNTKKFPILLTGHLSNFLAFDNFLLSNNTEIISEQLKIKDTSHLPYAISIGLALDGLSKDQKSVQFLQESFVPLKHLKTIGLTLLLFFISSLAISSVIYYASSMIYKEKESNLLSSLSAIEKLENIPNEKTSNLSFEERKNTIDEKIKKELKNYPNLSLAPKVSDLLCWINSHPLIESSSEKGSIEIISIDYDLIDKKEKKSNSAKVSLCLKINDPNLAQKFYESLSNYPNFIENENDISWTEENSKYKLSFFLKNLTPSEFYDRQN